MLVPILSNIEATYSSLKKIELKLNYCQRFPLRLGTDAFQEKEIQPKTLKILKVFKEISDHAFGEKLMKFMLLELQH